MLSVEATLLMLPLALGSSSAWSSSLASLGPLETVLLVHGVTIIFIDVSRVLMASNVESQTRCEVGLFCWESPSGTACLMTTSFINRDLEWFMMDSFRRLVLESCLLLSFIKQDLE